MPRWQFYRVRSGHLDLFSHNKFAATVVRALDKIFKRWPSPEAMTMARVMDPEVQYWLNIRRRAEVGVLDYAGLETEVLEEFRDRLTPDHRQGEIGRLIDAELKRRCDADPTLADKLWPLHPV